MLSPRIHAREPDKLIYPFPLNKTQALWADTTPFQEMVSGFIESIDKHFPKNKILTEPPSLLIEISIYPILSSRPIPYLILAISGTNKSKYGALIKRQNKKDITHYTDLYLVCTTREINLI